MQPCLATFASSERQAGIFLAAMARCPPLRRPPSPTCRKLHQEAPGVDLPDVGLCVAAQRHRESAAMSSMLQRWFITPTGREQERQGPKKFEDYTLKQVPATNPSLPAGGFSTPRGVFPEQAGFLWGGVGEGIALQ